eukprot:5195526-Amphidinium_carterae.1
MAQMFIGMSALKNSSMHVLGFLAQWFLQVLEGFALDALPCAGDLEIMWTALGVSPAHVEFLVETRLHWDGSRLRVAD